MRYRFLKKIGDIIIPLFINLEVVNYPILPENQGALLTVNHIHALDPILISYVLYPKWVHYLAKDEIFRIPILPLILKWLGVIPLNRQRPGPTSVKSVRNLFSENQFVGIFPQGTRRRTKFGKIKKGASRLALSYDVPLYPVALTGLEKVKLWDLFKRPKVKIIFGDPIYVDHREYTRDEIEILTTELELKMKNLYGKIVSKKECSS